MMGQWSPPGEAARSGLRWIHPRPRRPSTVRSIRRLVPARPGSRHARGSPRRWSCRGRTPPRHRRRSRRRRGPPGRDVRRDVSADGVGVSVLRWAPRSVGGQQHSALEDEVAGMRGAGEPVQERFEGVPNQVLLRRCPGPALGRGGSSDGLDPAKHDLAGAHPSTCSACRTGDFARGRRDAISISRAG